MDLLILLGLSQLSIGIAEHPFLGILGQEGQNPFLTTAPLRQITFFHQSVFAVKGNRKEVQVKRTPPRKPDPPDGIKPQPHQLCHLLLIPISAFPFYSLEASLEHISWRHPATQGTNIRNGPCGELLLYLHLGLCL